MFNEGRDFHGNMVRVGSTVTQLGSSGDMYVQEVKYAGEVLVCRRYDGKEIIIETNQVLLKY